ncbi:MAG: acetyl-CoA hydrolase/transferase family protein [Syntrophomonadaceae bacterium]|nr:acetyl-CoA hydrolase/transferase family protein [Syntrophomonadaceae bacterium]
MDYRELYRRKLVSVEMALDNIKSNDEVVTALAMCEPATLLSSLHTIKDRVENVSVLNAMMQYEYDFYTRPEMKGHFILNSWFYTDGPRAAHGLGTVSYVPLQLHQMSQKRLAYRSPDVFMGCVSPMDKHGYFSLSLSTVIEKDFIEKADIVIMEVNPRLPRTYGDTHIHISEIDYLVESERELPEYPLPRFTEKDNIIGGYAAELVEDGSTIQIGFGGISGAIAYGLRYKKDLGLHSEMFTDAVLNLWEAGAITNRKKTLWKDKFVCDIAMGTRRLFDFLDENVAVEFHRGVVVNDPAVIARNHNMVSINSALQFDLTGQCTAESIGPRLHSGTGGHKEFINGAMESPGGKSILALYSTAAKDTVSRIVPVFDPGTVVTTSRVDVDYIVTEYGVACLRGRSIRERVKEMISIAHPDFKDYLHSEAVRLQLW